MSINLLKTSNMMSLLQKRAIEHPDRTAYIFLTDGENEGSRLTYYELDAQAQAIAAQLQSLHPQDKRALLVYPPGLEFIAAFFGCLYADVIAVPTYPPRPNRPMNMLENIARDADIAFVLTTQKMLSNLKERIEAIPDLASLQWLGTDQMDLKLSEKWQVPNISSENIAFLQYTSGSTGNPKGVIITHENLLYNEQMIRTAFEHNESSTFVSWLPFYHDMGLIGNILQPLYIGAMSVLMAPMAFLQQPFRWLKAISDYRARTSGAPNFAYDLCVSKITLEQRVNLDLSCWDIAYNGAEPVRAEVLDRFSKAFAMCGFCREAFYPCYGMAEATLFITGGLKNRVKTIQNVQTKAMEQGRVIIKQKPEGCQEIVACGKTWLEQKVRIVDPERLCACLPTQIGEIWVAGPNVARGYWQRPEETETTFRAFLADTGEGPFLRTGDLGFMHQGELYITGRLKDLIIVRGRNYYPQDIELTTEKSHPALRKNSGAAFSIERHGEERLVVVQEMDRRYKEKHLEEVVAAIRRMVSEYHDLHVFAVVLIKHGTILKTSSGKIKRRACKDTYLKDELAIVVHHVIEESSIDFLEEKGALSREDIALLPPAERKAYIESYLLTQLAKITKRDPTQINFDQSLFSLGLDSMMMLQLQYQFESAFGINIPIAKLFEAPTLSDLSLLMGAADQGGQETVTTFPKVISNLTDRYEPFPLTDVQQAYWIGRSGSFELGNVATHGYAEYELKGIDLKRFETAWQKLIERHEMLRAIILEDGLQKILESVPLYRIETLDLRQASPEIVTAELEKICNRMSHQVLPADQWPLFEIRATLLKDGLIRLHVSIDLLISDAWSNQIIWRELGRLYADPGTVLPALEISFRDYVLAGMKLRESEVYQKALGYWRGRLGTLAPAPDLPLTKAVGTLKQPHFVRRQGRLDRERWQRLKTRASKSGITDSMALLGAFSGVLSVWSKSPRFTINLTLFNRLPLHPQVNAIAGDFTSLTLLEIDHSAGKGFKEEVRRIQTQLWKDLDHRYVSGVEVIRELTRQRGHKPRALMPVVFTSTLIRSAREEGPAGDGGAEHDLNNLWESIYGISQTPQVWLDHQIGEVKGELYYNWDSVEGIFPAGVLEEMFKAYNRLLECLADEEESWNKTMEELAPIPADQMEQRIKVNNTAAPISSERLHGRFAGQVLKRPDHPAVITPGRSLSYQALYQEANQIGHWLRTKAVQPNTLVAVVMEKGWEQVVAVLGILASGAAYLPIDPQLPKERLWHLLKQGEVRYVLTQPGMEKKIEWPENIIERLVISPETLQVLDANPLPPTQASMDLAYVIFTSGSTGEPKGVMIDHRGAVNTILDINERFQVKPEDRILGLSALNFDLSVYDIFGILAAGATLVLPDADKGKDPSHWLDLMEKHRVTLWNTVPALLEMLVEYVLGTSKRLPDTLRHVFMSGDWIPLNLPERIRQLGRNGIEIYSGGGATEASIWSILYPIEEVDPSWIGIPYGKPLANQSFQVLDGQLNPKPVWVPGQLYIGGIGLSRGYWKDEEKTKKSFIIHPQTRERLYCTGDLGRYLPDGNIEFLGREDTQVKIQGFRIELGEIESVLLQYPGVKAGTVTAIGDPQGEKRLVGYIVPAQEAVEPKAMLGDYGPGNGEGLILDPIERFKFKMTHPGLRKENGNRPPVLFSRPALDETLIKRYTQRRSYRKFGSENMDAEQLGRLLSNLGQAQLDGIPLPKYQYGSAGSLYPVQVYLYVKPERVRDLTGGTYYYHPEKHGLIPLSSEARMKADLYEFGNLDVFESSAFCIFLTARMEAIRPLYGEWSRDFCMLEAGLITQLLEMSAAEQGIGLCQIGGFNFEPVRSWFDLEPNHLYLHHLIGGLIAKNRTGLEALIEDTSDLRMFIELVEKESDRKAISIPMLKSGLQNQHKDLIRDVRQYLGTRLPEYMVPAGFVILEEIPLTPNGKVDRKALPHPDISIQTEKTYLAPRNETEEKLARIWSEILQIDRIGVYDNFFEIGGNSLLATIALSKIREGLGLNLPISMIFEESTVSGLAGVIDGIQNENNRNADEDSAIETIEEEI